MWSHFMYHKSLSGKRILLVDDKDLHIHLETKILHKERACTTRFRDGSELVAAVEEQATNEAWTWDAIVLDQTMETLDGLPTLEMLPWSFKKAVPIIMYSTEDSLQEKYISAGAACYLEKRPGSHNSIVATLKELLEPKFPT